MILEPEVENNDRLTSFCEHCVSRYSNSWPPNEQLLADEFIKYFQIKFLLQMPELEKLCSELKIELQTSKLPDGIYGSNFCFGEKRIITLKGKKETFSLHTHTALHEIREMIEYGFTEIGFPTFNSHNQEEKADDFALSVTFVASGDYWNEWITRTQTIQSKWRKIGIFGLIGAGGLLFCILLFFSITSPYFEDLRALNKVK